MTPSSPPPDAADLVGGFLDAQTPRTSTAYGSDLRTFAAWYGPPHDVGLAVGELLAGTPGDANRVVGEYRAAMRDVGLASSTIGRRICCMRSLVAKAREWGRVTWSLDVAGPKAVAYRDTRGPGDDGWDRMRAIAKRDVATGVPRAFRDRAMLRVGHDLGLRVSELVGLDVSHVDFHDAGRPSAVWVLRKGRTERERKTLPRATGDALAAWLKARGELPGPLFVRLDTARGASPRLSAQSFYDVVASFGARAGIARRVSPHQLRHHAISCVLERNGGDVVKGQEFSGHKNLATLAIYLDHLKDRAGEMADLIADDDD